MFKTNFQRNADYSELHFKIKLAMLGDLGENI